MSDHLTEGDLIDELFRFEKSEAEIIAERGPGKWDVAPIWCAHKDGKIVRPVMWWKPTAEAWEKQSIEFHAKQAEEAKRFAQEMEERIRREKKSARTEEIETSFGGAGAGTPATTKESRSKSIELVIG